MRAGRQTRVLERILGASTLEQLFDAPEREQRDTYRMLLALAAGTSASRRLLQTVGGVRRVTPEFLADRAAVLVASIDLMMRHDPFFVLGVTPAATSEEIQRRYRKLAKQRHPDVAAGPKANAAFHQLQQAYEALRDPERRVRHEARYTRAGGPIIWEATRASSERLATARRGAAAVWRGMSGARHAMSRACGRVLGGIRGTGGRLGPRVRSGGAACLGLMARASRSTERLGRGWARAVERSVGSVFQSIGGGLRRIAAGFLRAAQYAGQAVLGSGARAVAGGRRIGMGVISGVAVSLRRGGRTVSASVGRLGGVLPQARRIVVAPFRAVRRAGRVVIGSAARLVAVGWRLAMGMVFAVAAGLRRGGQTVSAGVGRLSGVLPQARRIVVAPFRAVRRAGRVVIGSAARVVAGGWRLAMGTVFAVAAGLRRGGQTARNVVARVRTNSGAVARRLPGSVRVQQAASEVRRLLSVPAGAGRAVGRAWTHRWANVRLRYAARASRVRSPRRPLIERFGRGLQHGVLAGSLAGVGWVLVTTVFVPGDGIREPGGPTASREQPQDAAGSPGDARLAGLIADSMTRAAESAARESAAPPTVGESASDGSSPAAASPSEIGADELIEEDSAPVAEAAPTEPAPAPTLATARLAVVRPEAVVETADSGDDDAAAADVTPTEAARLVRTFRRYYEERRVEKLVSLFADGAIENTRTGRQAIGAAYHAALTPLRSVRYELGRLRFEERSPGIRVRSPFTITYARPEQAQIVRGVAVWDIVRQGDGLEIARLTYDVHR